MIRKILSKRKVKTVSVPGRITKAVHILARFNGNPILEPEPMHHWESKAVFNPAAIYEQGKVHLVYRAITQDDVSVMGYASSNDGLELMGQGREPENLARVLFS